MTTRTKRITLSLSALIIAATAILLTIVGHPTVGLIAVFVAMGCLTYAERLRTIKNVPNTGRDPQ